MKDADPPHPARNGPGAGLPGEFPFTRGIYPGMYRDRLWTMRQYAGFGDARQSNQRYRYLLSQGVSGLSVAFDLPTQMGYDSDHSLAAGEVGRAGVTVSSITDMETLFERIPLEKVSTSMTINATAMILLALYVTVARKQGVPWSRLHGTVQNDILKEYIARGTYIYPPRASLRIVTDLFSWAARELPNWNTISISGYHMREAGATAAQELAFTLANATVYIDAALDAGLAVDEFAPRLSFFFSADRNFLDEIAKFRAARRLYAHLMTRRYETKDPRSAQMRFHVQTAGSSLTAQQPLTNVVRTSYEALSAVLGGAQSIHTNAYDEALALPAKEAANLALRTQQVIAEETGVVNTADPLGGAYAIEQRTDEIEAEARRYLDRIDTMGGMLSAIGQGFIQREIHNAAYEFQHKIESGEQTIVGVNAFQSSSEAPIPTFRPGVSLEDARRAELAAFRGSRDAGRLRRSLDTLAETAQGGKNLMPAVLQAVESQATVGEISDVLRDAFGEHQASMGF